MGAREIKISNFTGGEKTGKLDKFLCVRFHFVKFEITQFPNGFRLKISDVLIENLRPSSTMEFKL